jgi:hypothetical protein
MAKLRSLAKHAISLSVCFFSLAVSVFAANPIATMTSAVPFVLDGHSVTSPGVTSFPLVPGDTVATTNGPAVLLFHDGSTVKLGENSSAKIDTVGENPKVILLAGALDYKLVAGSNVKVTNLDTVRKPVVEAAPSANVSRGRAVAVLSSPSFILSAGGSAVGLAFALNPFSSGSSVATSVSTTGTLTANLPPVSRHR